MSIKLQVILLMAIISGSFSKANINSCPVSARSQGIGHAGVMLTDVWSGMQNPSGLAALSDFSFAFHYENHFLVPEFGMGAFTLNIPTKTGIFGLNYSCYGYSFYRENQASLSFGKPFGEKFRAGIGVHYLRIHQGLDYGNLFAFIPCLGFQIVPLEKLIFGFQIFNPAGQHYNSFEGFQIPTIIRMGLGYTIGEEMFICMETEKNLNEKPNYYGGFECNLLKSLTIRFGIISGEYPRYSFGLGLRNHLMRADLAITRHPVLGFSPAITIGYTFK